MASQGRIKDFVLTTDENMKTIMGVRWKRKGLIIAGIILLFFVIIFTVDFQSRLSSVSKFAAAESIHGQNDWPKRVDDSFVNFKDSVLLTPHPNGEPVRQHGYTLWSDFHTTSNISHAAFVHDCVGHIDYNITGLVTFKEAWKKSTSSQCLYLLTTFSTIFELEGRKCSILLPKLFATKVKKWLGNDEALMKEVYDQDAVHVINHFTREHTIFNPLRDKRPVMPPDIPEKKYVDDIVNASRASCDFCKYRQYTAEHTFGRVESKHSFSASNIFKIDPLHAILALKNHHPLEWDYEQFMDLMDLTLVWLRKAKQNYPEAKFPSMIWDVLPKCGASQIHPHMHVVFDPQRYHGEVEVWRRGAQDYHEETGQNYFTDLVRMYSLFNLTIPYGKAVAFANLVPKKDHEVVVMSQEADADFYTLIYFVLRGFLDDLGKMCFSMGIGLPALGESKGKIPAYARIITRGVVTDIRNDISSLELFMATNVNINPFTTADIVRNSVAKRQAHLKIDSSQFKLLKV